MTTTWRGLLAVVAAVVLSQPMGARGVQPGVVEDWSGGGVSGWSRLDALNGTQGVLSNEGGALQAVFAAQSVSKPEADVILADGTASAGAFAGDYYAAGVSRIRFRLNCVDGVPGDVRLYVHSASGNQWWYHPLSGVVAGQWQTFEVPVSYQAGWFQGVGDSANAYEAALHSVTWVGLYIRRSGSTSAQRYQVDDFALDGAPAVASIAGTVSYGGEQGGAIRVLAAASAEAWSSGHATEAGVGGGYRIDGVPTLAGYFVKAYVDSNGNGENDFWEARGEWNGGAELGRLLGDVGGVDVVLSDPTTADGLPYWWLREHFGLQTAEDAGAVTAASDADGDGADNYAEYRAGTDPHNGLDRFEAQLEEDADGFVVRWTYLSGRSYAVWRSSDLEGGFALRQPHVQSDHFVDTEATGSGPYFYRVEVEEP